MPDIAEEKLKRIKKIESAINKNLFLFCGIITGVVIIMYLIEFFSRGKFPPAQISFFYIGIVLFYSLHKEMLRWLGEKEIERQGEWFFYVWIILTLTLYIINFSTKNYFSGPLNSLREITITTLQVGAIFVFTRLSKIVKIFFEKR